MKAVVPLCQMLLVVGSQNSSNSRRLVEVCEKMGVPAYLIDDLSEVQAEWLEGVDTVAVTAGASAPENLVQELIESLRRPRIRRAGRNGNQGRRRAVQSAQRIGTYCSIADHRTSYDADMTPSLQLDETLLTSCAEGAAPRRGLSAVAPGPAGLLVGRSHGRHHAGIRFHLAGAVATSAAERRVESAHAAADRQSGALDSRPPVARRRIQYLRGRSFGNQRDHQGVHGAEARRAGDATIRIWRAPASAFWRMGGLQAANSYVKVNLSLFGLYPREHARPFRPR